MPKFKYELLTPDQQTVTGTLEAPNLLEASAQARAMQGTVINVEPAATAASYIDKMRNIRVESGPGLKDILAFTKQLAVMIRAGISIREALDGIADQTKNGKFKSIITQCRSDVESGSQFSEAIAKHPKVFSPMYVNMVRASEMSGTFAKMLDRIGVYQEEQAATRSMVVGAMVYPGVLFTMSVGAVIFLLTWVLPKFMGIFKGKEDLLPKPTVMLLAMSDFMRYNWQILVSAAVACVIAFVVSLKYENGRRFWDWVKLHVPVLSKMFRALAISRSLQTMGELLQAGVPMLEVLRITADISGNAYYKDMWLKVQKSVQEGSKVVSELQKHDLLPPSVVQMISAGEESGRLGDVLSDVSEFYAKELKDIIKAVTSLLEPLMIVFMGVVVGFIAMSIILPVFKMSSMAGH